MPSPMMPTEFGSPRPVSRCTVARKPTRSAGALVTRDTIRARCRPRRSHERAIDLRPRFVHDVERRLRDPAEPAEPGVAGEPPDRLLAGLRAEGVPAVLGQRVGYAQERGERVVHPP